MYHVHIGIRAFFKAVDEEERTNTNAVTQIKDANTFLSVGLLLLSMMMMHIAQHTLCLFPLFIFHLLSLTDDVLSTTHHRLWMLCWEFLEILTPGDVIHDT